MSRRRILEDLLGIAVIAYWSIGWAFAYGDSHNETVGLFIGHTQFFLHGVTDYAKYGENFETSPRQVFLPIRLRRHRRDNCQWCSGRAL